LGVGGEEGKKIRNLIETLQNRTSEGNKVAQRVTRRSCHIAINAPNAAAAVLRKLFAESWQFSKKEKEKREVRFFSNKNDDEFFCVLFARPKCNAITWT